MITFEQFKKEILSAMKNKPSDWRDGQFVFNYVDYYWGVAREAQYNHGIDCFYKDDKIDDFIECCYKILTNLESDE